MGEAVSAEGSVAGQYPVQERSRLGRNIALGGGLLVVGAVSGVLGYKALTDGGKDVDAEVQAALAGDVPAQVDDATLLMDDPTESEYFGFSQSEYASAVNKYIPGTYLNGTTLTSANIVGVRKMTRDELQHVASRFYDVTGGIIKDAEISTFMDFFAYKNGSGRIVTISVDGTEEEFFVFTNSGGELESRGVKIFGRD